MVANLPDLIQGEHIVDFVNAHLYVAMVAGVPLFLVWCLIWLTPVIDGWTRRSMWADGIPGLPSAIVVTFIVAIAASAITERNLIWPTIALALAGPCSRVTSRREARRVVPPTARRLPDAPVIALGRT